MRSALLAVFILGFAVLGDAQTRPLSAGGTLTVDQTTPKIFSAKQQETTNGGQTYLMRGDVRIQIGEADIRADEAEMDASTREIKLRGNVRLLLSPAPLSPPR